MGLLPSKEQSIATAIENQDVSELRTILKDLTADQIRAAAKSYVPSDENQCTILHLATWQDNPDILAPFLDYIDDYEVRDGFGWTPLMTAVNRGSKQNVAMLLSRGATVDCDWVGGMSLIADAIGFNDLELITMLIDNGAKVVPTAEMLANGEEQNGIYLLHYAVDDGLLEVAQLLIEKGKIPLNTVDQSGWSALHIASGHNTIDMVNLLLAKGADINIRDSQGNTPLAWAREMEAKEVVEELVKRGALADKEWHGEKIELNAYEEEAPEDYEAGYDNEGQDVPDTVEHGRFEIEVEDPKAQKNNNNKNSLDALQRQRPAAQPKF